VAATTCLIPLRDIFHVFQGKLLQVVLHVLVIIVLHHDRLLLSVVDGVFRFLMALYHTFCHKTITRTGFVFGTLSAILL